MIELNKIYCGDARELLRQIPDESVDLVFTDPPYPKAFSNCFNILARMQNELSQMAWTRVRPETILEQWDRLVFN